MPLIRTDRSAHHFGISSLKSWERIGREFTLVFNDDRRPLRLAAATSKEADKFETQLQKMHDLSILHLRGGVAK